MVRRPRSSARARAALLLLAGLLAAAAARAAGTDPTLTLTAAEAAAGGEAVLVRLHGSLQFDDLLQFDFPAGIVIYQGSQFVHVPITGQPVSGTATVLAGGLTPAELTILFGLGSPAPPPARLVTLSPTSVSVVLPPGLHAGPATAVIYAVLEGDNFLSNPITVILP